MVTIKTQSSPKKKRQRKNKPRIRTETHDLYDGEAILFRTPASGKVWQFQMWIKVEKEYLRRSTRTRNLDEAIGIGKELFFDTRAKISGNISVFPKTMKEVAELFLEAKKKEIGINKTKGRWVTLRSQMKHLLGYLGDNKHITEVSRNAFDEYYIYRKKRHPEVVNTTLKNETNTIRSVFRFAISRGLLQIGTLLPEFPYLQAHSRKRQPFELEEWKRIYQFFRTNNWLKNESTKIEEQRKYIRDFVMILINSGIRFGEARRLKWRNIQIKNKKQSDKKYEAIGYINLDADQTKNNKERTTVARRGDVFERIKRYSKHTKPNDYVFCDNDTGKQITKNAYYRHWKFLVNSINLADGREDTSFYCFRHTYATWRLMAHTDVFLLAKNMGCSVKFIEDHYGQIKTTMMWEELTNSVKKSEFAGFLLE